MKIQAAKMIVALGPIALRNWERDATSFDRRPHNGRQQRRSTVLIGRQEAGPLWPASAHNHAGNIQSATCCVVPNLRYKRAHGGRTELRFPAVHYNISHDSPTTMTRNPVTVVTAKPHSTLSMMLSSITGGELAPCWDRRRHH